MKLLSTISLLVALLFSVQAGARPATVRSTRRPYLEAPGLPPPASSRGGQPRQPPTIPVPPVLQHSEAACGLASLQSVISYYGLPAPRGSHLVRMAQAKKPGAAGYTYQAGTPERTLERLASQAGLQVRARSDMSLAELARHVARGTPVIVGYQAWASNPQRVDWKRDEADGHYSVVIGFGDRRGRPYNGAREMRSAARRDPGNVLVWLMDPYQQFGTRGYIPLGEFLERWHWPGAPHYGMALQPGPTTGSTRFRVHVESVARVN